MSYAFFTDVNADMPNEFYEENNIFTVPVGFSFDNEHYMHYADYNEMSEDEFYRRIRIGMLPKTAQTTFLQYIDFFEPFLKSGHDIFYICFSSALSGMYSQSLIAKKELEEKYPERKIVIIDSKRASGILGMLVYLAAKKVKQGATLEEITEYVEEIKLKTFGFFVVDDLDHLKRGGRVSGITAAIGKALQIKPLLSENDEGELIQVGKIRGVNKVNDTLIEKLTTFGDNIENQTVFLVHSHSPEQCRRLEERVNPLVKNTFTCSVGPTVGTHVGPGLLAVVFIRK